MLKTISKAKLKATRDRLGLVAFHLGKVNLELCDIVYWSDKFLMENNVGPVCQEWLIYLATKLNLPNQMVLQLLTLGKKYIFGNFHFN